MLGALNCTLPRPLAAQTCGATLVGIGLLRAAAYICQGPLLASCGITCEDVQRDEADWLRLGKQLAHQLGFDYESMNPVQR